MAITLRLGLDRLLLGGSPALPVLRCGQLSPPMGFGRFLPFETLTAAKHDNR
jgi:hypothetical protein